MKAAVITFPGSNCDMDAVRALQKLGNKVTRLWHRESSIADDFDLIVIPGGFSYGDYLRSGAMASISPIMGEVKRLAAKGTKILGICNGFQILTETGLLEGALLRNKNMKFINRDVTLRVENAKTSFTKKYKKGQQIKIPIAHMDGNYFASSEVIKKLEDGDQIVFRYTENPNGSMHDIAGIINKKGNVLGMMPHPERAADEATKLTDGILLFESLQALN